jgi:hypothetical protein
MVSISSLNGSSVLDNILLFESIEADDAITNAKTCQSSKNLVIGK